MSEPSTHTDNTFQVKNRIQDPFARVLNDIIEYYGPAMGAYGVAVYTVYARFANYKTNECFPSLARVCKILSVSRPTVIEVNNRLIKLGLLKKSSRMKNDGSLSSNLYELLPPVIPIPDKILKELFPEDFVPDYTNAGNKVSLTPNVASKETQAGGSKPDLPPPQGTKDGGSQRTLPPPTPPSKPDLPPRSATLTRVVSHVDSNEKKLTKLIEQENNNVVVDQISRLTNTFKDKDPNVTEDDMKGHYDECLVLAEGDRDKALVLLEDGVKVVMTMKNPNNPQAVLSKAISRGWKPTAKKTYTDAFDEVEKRRRAAEEARLQVEKDHQYRLVAPMDFIIGFFKDLPPNVFSLEKRLKLTADNFEGNPIINDTLEKLRKGEF